ncbi:MAG: hypothetical protein Q9218_000503 [Villophora microphyllina]
MPFRDKVKKAFGKSNEEVSETSSDLSHVQLKASSKKSKKPKVDDYPDNVYKPGEIPESKYKGPYDKKHQQKLHAFSFANAFQERRKSEQSLYSPMGSRLPSRVGSFISRKSFGPRSRQQSRVEDTLMENTEADDTVENGELHKGSFQLCSRLTLWLSVGLSRQHTREEVPPTRIREKPMMDGFIEPRVRESNMRNVFANSNFGNSNQANGFPYRIPDYGDGMDGLSPTKTLTNDDTRPLSGGSFGGPFSADDLVHAMTNSTLGPAAVQA